MNNNTTISTYNTVTNALTTVAVVSPPAAATLQDLAETPNGLLYFTDNNGELWQFNPATPTVAPTEQGMTTLGATARLGTDSLGRLLNVNAATTLITYINPATGATISTVALTGGPVTGAGGDVAVAPNGTLYEVNGTQLLSFSPNGGAVTTISLADGASAAVTSLAFDPTTGVLYGGVTGGPPSNVYTFNLTTGVATLFNTVTTGGTFNDFASLPTYPQLSVTKSHTGTFAIGSTGTYTIKVANIGTYPTSGTITVTDTLPTGLTFNAAGTSGTGWSCSEATAPTVVCTTTASLAAGTSAPAIALAVNVVGPAGSVTNSVTATGGSQPIILPTATANDPTTIVSSAALSMAKSAPSQAAVGGLIAYSILVSNAGPSPANGAAFSDPIPANLTIEGTPTCAVTSGAATCGVVTVAGQTVSSIITTLPSGASVTFTIDTKAGATGTYTNTASIAPPTGTTSSGTPTSSATTVVGATSGFTKTVQDLSNAGESPGNADTGKPGDTLQYVLTFTNTTGGAISNFSVSDTTPANTTFVSAVCGALPAGITACTIASPAIGATGTVTYTYAGSLANGTSGSFTMSVKIK